MLRVISGTARNHNLITPEGLETRPTTDRIRETLFNVLQFDIPGSVVVDLFAGSGAIGIESLSRGAKYAYFVDNAKEPVKCITENLNHTHLADKACVLCKDAISALSDIHEAKVDFVFMDPPYSLGIEQSVLSILINMPYFTDDTSVIIEAALDTEFDFLEGIGLEVYKTKEYKTNKHLFIRKRVSD